MSRKSKTYKSSVYITATILISSVMLSIFEIGARVNYALKDINHEQRIKSRVVTQEELDVYERPDPNASYNWLLVPGFQISIGKMLQEKQESGHTLAAKVLKSKIKNENDANRLYVSINSDGYKGDEILDDRSKTRMLVLGDSCTFGLLHPYARVVDRQLNSNNIPVEVINAGVEGYSPINVLARIEEFKALSPEITTLYIGWNALYQDTQRYSLWENKLYSIRLVHDFYKSIRLRLFGVQKLALEQYNKKKNTSKNSLQVQELNDYSPSFMDDVEEIIKQMKSVGSKVVILTLPGLFVMEEEPTPKALKMGHLPPFTDNPYVLAKMTERYNFHLKRLAKKHDLLIIDLDQWSREGLSPRDYYFFDSVHFDDEGAAKVGMFIAEQLRPVVVDLQSQDSTNKN